MKAKIIDGRKLANEIREEVKRGIQKSNIRPGLATLIIGNNEDSLLYVRIKERAARDTGILFVKREFPSTFKPQQVIQIIQEFNSKKDVHGIIVQLPLPEGFERHTLLKQIHPFKDVDSLHPKNLGLLVEGHPFFLSPFTLGVIALIKDTDLFKTKTVDIGLYKGLTLPILKGVNIVLIGNGLLVGRPLSIFFSQQGATVTTINTSTKNHSDLIRRADIIVTGTRGKDVLSADDVKHGSIVISGGNDIEDEEFYDKEIFLAPSKGGIGPLTVSYLLYNTFISAIHANR